MYTLHIEDFAGIKRADIEIPRHKIALIGGKNGAGKSSTAKALACAATAVRMPCGAALKEAEKYIRRGTDKATVFMRTPEGNGRKIVWTDGQVEMSGEADKIGESAAGLKKLSSLDEKERSKVLTDILKAKVTQDDFFTEVIAELGQARGKTKAQELWPEVDTLGFDSVLEGQKSEGIILKRKWQEATGKSRWSVKALDWLPENWTPDIGTSKVEDLAKAVAQAQEDVEQAIRRDAVQKANAMELKTQVALLPALEKVAGELRDEVKTLAEVLMAERKSFELLPLAEQPKVHNCPECTTALIIEGGQIVKAQVVTADEIAQRKANREKQQKHIADLEKQLAVIETKSRDAHANLKIARDSEQKLKRLESDREALKAGGVDVDSARLSLVAAESRVKARSTKEFADMLHEQIMANDKLLAILAPEGLRRKKLELSLRKFADELVYPLCKIARNGDPKWQDVSILPDLSIAYGVGEYSTVSGSEQFRTDVTLQVALAIQERRPLVIIDGADELDSEGRGGLMRLLASTHLTSLVCMMVSNKEQLPDIGKGGTGQSYWIDQGVLSPLAAVTA